MNFNKIFEEVADLFEYKDSSRIHVEYRLIGTKICFRYYFADKMMFWNNSIIHISFDDILESTDVPDNIKERLLFNLDLFK